MEVDWQNGACSFGYQTLDQRRIYRVITWQDIAQRRDGAALTDGTSGRNIGIADGDDFVAAANPGGAQSQKQADRARMRGDSKALFNFGGESLFKLLANGIGMVIRIEEDRFKRRHDFGAQALMGFDAARARNAKDGF